MLVNGKWIDLDFCDYRPGTGCGKVIDEQNFFPKITKRNECRALSCFLNEGQSSPEFCWIWDDSWEYEHVTCDLTNAFDGWKGDKSYFENLGFGCYCKVQKMWVAHECCLDGDSDGNNGHKNCITDLTSSQHPCNNIEGITWDNTLGPLLPNKNNCVNGMRPKQQCCFPGTTGYPGQCTPVCQPTYHFHANVRACSGGQCRG